MNRRDFVARLGTSVAAGGAAVGTAAMASRERFQDGAEALQKQIKAVHERLDQMDDSHKRLFRALVFVASVSTGMDILNLLRGDLLS